MKKAYFTPIFSALLIALIPSYAVLAQKDEPAWEDGVVGRVDVALFQGGHVDKPGHVSIFRATGCTYVQKCGWIMTVEVQQTGSKLILQKKIPVHNRIVSMHYEDVNLRGVTGYVYAKGNRRMLRLDGSRRKTT